MSKKMTQYTTKNLKWIHDPAHSWLKAPLNWLIDFGLINEISGYSYIDNGSVYLEEDCDATKLIDYLLARGCTKETLKEVPEVVLKKMAPIRRFRRYPFTKTIQGWDLVTS